MMARKLTDQERIEARHLLQELSENAKNVRDAMDPLHGVLGLTDEAWLVQWAGLIRQLEYFTGKILEG